MKLTKFTAPEGKILAKTLGIGHDGRLEKQAAANMGGGEYEEIEVNDMRDLAHYLGKMDVNQAIGLGIPPLGKKKGRLCTERQRHEGRCRGGITRSKCNFVFGTGEGVMLLDFDFRDDRPPLPTGSALLEWLRAQVPQLTGVQMLWRPSSSSLIRNAETGETVHDIRGQHVFVRVKSASEIPALGKAIVDRMWLKGLGFCGVSKCGAILEYTPVDKSVFSPERLVYTGGAHCLKPLQQDRPLPSVVDGTSLLELSSFIELKPAEVKRIQNEKKEARDAVADIAKQTREKWAEEQVAQVSDPQERLAAQSSLIEAVTRRTLTQDINLKLTDGTIITVGHVLEEPEKYAFITLHDPLEPEYPSGTGDPRIATIYRNHDGVTIWSWAHGGTYYRLEMRRLSVNLTQGYLTQTIHSLVAASKDHLYRFGSTVIAIAPEHEWHKHGGGFFKPQNEDSLRYMLGQRCRFFTVKTRPNGESFEVPADIDNGRCSVFIESAHLQQIRGVLDHPIITVNGRVIQSSGLDSETGLMLLETDRQPFVPLPAITEHRKQALNAFIRVWRLLFSEFHFSSARDRSTAFAALLSAVLRPVLPTCPAFLISAPAAGSGKTYLIDVISRIAEGKPITTYPFPKREEETAKFLFSLGRGGHRCLLLDNVGNGDEINSPELCRFITSEVFGDRVLKESRTESVPNVSVVFVTGNNIMVSSDAGRRFLKIRLDTRSDSPHALAYKSDPIVEATTHRQQIISDLLTMVAAAMQDKSFQHIGVPLASFGAWDLLVRQTVAYVALCVNKANIFGDFDIELESDVVHALCKHEDPESELERGVLGLLHEWFECKPFTSQDVRDRFADLDNNHGMSTQLSFDRIKAEQRENATVALAPFLTQGYQPAVNTKKFGKWLNTRIDKRVRGVVDIAPDVVMVLVKATIKSGISRYQIEVIGAIPEGAVVHDFLTYANQAGTCDSASRDDSSLSF